MSNENAITVLQPTAAPVSPVPAVPPVLSVLSVPCVSSPTPISRKRNRPHAPNCTVCDRNPSRFLAFRAKQNEVEAEYGFRLGVPRRTDAERDGYRRYMRDWRRRYGEAHREVRKAYRHAYWLNVTKRGFDSLAEANGDEAAIKRKAARAERKSLLKQGIAAFGYKVRAFENKKRKMRKALGLPEMKRDFTPEQRKAWNDYLRESRIELQNWLIERMRQEQAKAQKRANVETREERERREKEREERKRLIFEKYGFTLGKAPVTPEEIEGFKRWQRDQEAAYRERNREHLTAYNRDYRRRKRAEALAKEQTTWTPAQWKAWKKREADKACPPGSPSWLVREVVKRLAAKQSLPADAVMGRLIELGGLDFLIKGAESIGRSRCNRPSSVAAAVRALAIFLDPDHAAMFGGGKG